MTSPSSEKPSEVQSILVIHQGALGDFILALPALETLRKAFPHAKSVIMGYPRILDLVERRFYADAIFSIDQKGMASFFNRDGSLDLTLSEFFKTFRPHRCLWKKFRRNDHPESEEGLSGTNPFDQFFSTLGGEGSFNGLSSQAILSTMGFLDLSHISETLFERVGSRVGDGFLRSKGGLKVGRSKVMILHPGSGSKRKVCPFHPFIHLARTLQDRLRSKILIVLGPAEGPDVQKAFETMGPNVPILAKGLTLLQLASVMEGCRFFVGNDSGISHMGAALGLPTVAIFGPTDQRVWAPRGEETVVTCRAFTARRVLRKGSFM